VAVAVADMVTRIFMIEPWGIQVVPVVVTPSKTEINPGQPELKLRMPQLMQAVLNTEMPVVARIRHLKLVLVVVVPVVPVEQYLSSELAASVVLECPAPFQAPRLSMQPAVAVLTVMALARAVAQVLVARVPDQVTPRQPKELQTPVLVAVALMALLERAVAPVS
jgi:hypothetical protein